MKPNEPLIKLSGGDHHRLSLNRNTDIFRKFLKALNIWLLKPQVADRRILSSIVVNVKIFNRHEVENREHIFADFIKEKSTLINTKAEDILKEMKYNELNNVLILKKVLPRQSDRMIACNELVVIDILRKEVFFIRLQSGPEHLLFPVDVNQSWSYKVSCDIIKQEIAISMSPYYKCEHPVKALPELTPPTNDWLRDMLLPKLVKWTSEVDPDVPVRVKKSVISMESYSEVHGRLKSTYADKFVKNWTEKTDPKKFVYEDIAIAAYLIVLWEEERERCYLKNKQSFVDLGCGNGLLVHILNSEGYPGKGIDLRRRKIWDLYGPETILEEHTITPSNSDLMEGYDWLIGNHSDELTPWIPVMAFRSSPNTRYLVLPCCFYDFDKKFVKRDVTESQYSSYLKFIREVGRTCGYEVKEDSLRIPSTKRICQIGFKRQSQEPREIVDDQIQRFIDERCLLSRMDSIDDFSDQIIIDEYTKLKKLGQASSGGNLTKWAANFEPRGREEKVRNCSRLNEDLKEMIVKRVFEAVMSSGKVGCGVGQVTEVIGEQENEEIGHEIKRQKKDKWERGGKITISEGACLFDRDVLKQLKSECGGLKTLLKNSFQVFLVAGDSIQVRDWSDFESSLPQSSSKNTIQNIARRKDKYKTKKCWFYLNHPDSCPRKKEDCPFAHGEEDLRMLPTELNNMAI